MKKSELYGFAGTGIATIIVLLLLWFIVLPGLQAPEEEGIMVSFGNADDGGGNSTFQQPANQPEVSAPSKPVSKPAKEEVITQKDNSAVLAEQKKKKEAEANKKAQDEKNRQIAEQKKKEQNAINNANSTMSGLFGNTNGSGTGNTSGNTQQGNPAGSGSVGKPIASVYGRSTTGKIAEPNDIYQEGKAVVSIIVDTGGNVIYAKVTGGNISDDATKKLVENAARRTKFTSGNSEVRGTITYNLRFN